ncbi:zinc ribbon domain-containing protein [Streptomyces sp. MA15]|uniref:RNA-guided endonuclease InsQ/TnpB family protein n=1 Tax=Streptomyces sp. MA15 TaxID=3055061 RepID=UPI0025B1F495|nr:zinc ribbon domain-containing protein [Streptomyces sp. MA15]MDN3267685.1 zinc ribbon domain-containing protein [Streptomyces sp. MA15]
MQLRYRFRLYPSAGQRTLLARAFGCARVVCDDALKARETARSEGMPFPKTGDLSKTLITEAKKTPGRAWLGEVSAVVLQQSLRDLDTAYKNFFDGLKIRENQAVAVEDLAAKGLARTRLAKSVHDAGWSAFVSMLEYKAARYGRTFVKMGRFEPTSQVCSQCGVKDGPKPLHVRVWTCGACGAVLDRDINAAVDVAEAAGLAVSACGAQVRPGLVPAPRSEAGTHPKPQPSTARQAGIAVLQSGEDVKAA